MAETWLHPNWRVLLFGAVIYVLVILLGVGLTLNKFSGFWGTATTIIGCLLAGGGACAIVLFVVQSWRPRIAYQNGMMLFYLRSGPPVAAPIEIVEAFFLGQGPTQLTGSKDEQRETINLVARLAERTSEWHHVEVDRELGHWCDGYVTIHGTWCQRLNEQTVMELNRRLANAKRNRPAS